MSGMELVPDLEEEWGPVRTAVPEHEARRKVLDERIGVLSAQIHALEAELVGVVAEFD